MIKKLTVIGLTFLFIFTPLASALAAEASTASTATSTQATDIPSADASPDSQSAPSVVIPENQAPLPDLTDNSKISPNDQKNDSKDTNPPPPSILDSSEDPDPRLDNGRQPAFFPHADETSGALISDYPLKVPPGRNGFQPDLKLQYNSQNSNSIDSEFGAGWSLNVPYIERINKSGVNNLYGTSTTNYFNSSLSGELVANNSTTSYISKTDNGEFLDYHFQNNGWTATDKKGYKYYFGNADYGSSATTGPAELYQTSFYNDADLISYWRFEGNANDAKGSNHGTSTNVSYDSSYGKFSQGGHFNGSSSDIAFGNVMGFEHSDPFSAVFWFKRSSNAAGQILISKFVYSDPYRGWDVMFGGNNLFFRLRNTYSSAMLYVRSTAAYTDNTWHHGAVTYDGGGLGSGVNIYVDGSPVATNVDYDTLSGGTILNSANLHIGNGGGAAEYATGDFDDLAVFGRELTAAEVLDLSGETLAVESAASQQNDPYNASRTYKWMLNKVIDPNGNEIKYEYYKSGGQIYPSSVSYAGNTTTTPLYTVDFLREARTDVSTSTKTGFQVVTGKRINEIDVKIDGSWARKYALAYTTADNGRKNLLSGITESGKDESGNTTTLPATTFTYQTNNGNWSNPGISFPVQFKYAILADVNGDQYSDIMYSVTNSTTTTMITYLNNTHGGWATSTPYAPPVVFYGLGTSCDPVLCDKGVRLADVNGDGLADILNNNSGAYLNTGSGWTASSTWVSPLQFSNPNQNYGNSQYGEIGDVNGDGLPDVFQVWHDVASEYHNVYLNNGNGFTSASGWSVAQGIDKQISRVNTDLNGDGLTDLMQGFDSTGSGDNYNFSAINNSTSLWISYLPYSPPIVFVVDSSDQGVRVYDINGDGLPDLSQRLYGGAGGDITDAYFNTGGDWVSAPSWVSPLPFASSLTSQDQGTRVADINGDGMSDIVQAKMVNDAVTSNSRLSTEKRVDMLTKITYPTGGSTSISYKPSGQYKDGSNNLLNPSLPLNIDTVYQIANYDGAATTTADTYTYKGGKYYYNGAFDRKFAGFAEIDKTDAASSTVKTFYHIGTGTDSSHGQYQDNYWKIGKPYRVEQYDSSGNLFKKVINKWDSATSTTNSLAGFVKLAQTVTSNYDGTANHKDKAESYTYNNTTGDVTQKVEWGEVTGSDDGSFSDTGADDFTATLTYATSSASPIISLLSSQSTADHGSAKVKETKLYYDNLSFGNADKGNVTKQEMWKTGSTYIDVEKSYNSYGLVTQEKDPRDKIIAYSYDANNLYPATVTNPLSQAIQYTYDYSSGKVKQTTDANGNNFQNVYDGLDRLIEQKQPNTTTTSTLETKLIFAYTDTANANNVHQTNYLTATATMDSYVYYDGLHRPIQTRKSAEGGNYEVKDSAYNNIGLLDKESLPYFSSGSATTTATSTVALFTNYFYDALGRAATTTNAVGTTTTAYLDWRVTITDPLGKTKDLYNDAFGNLVQVDEHNATSTYTTTYTYDYNRNLTKITDALGNIRNFTYDGLGRRTGAEDLHASGDGTFGSYAYTYDDSGNLTQKVDPKSQTINYTYDDINRPLTEDYTGQAGTEVTYVYDTCTQGKGRLCTASSSAVTILNAYDPEGNILTSTSTISSTAYPISYTYDRQGNQLTIINPDNSQVFYTYNTAGLIETVSQKNTPTSTADSIVTNFNYSPTEQISLISYGNNATTTNAYDAGHLYRLSNKTSTSASTTVQSLAYTYDNNGNITQIADSSNTHTAKTVNYGYDDLNRLTSASSTSATYGSNYLYSYVYDGLGNILSRTENGTTTVYTYATSTTSGYMNPDTAYVIGNATSTYDTNGNLLTSSSPSGGGQGEGAYTWDYGNRLLSVSIPATEPGSSTTTVTSSYDSSGQRISYSTSAGTGTPTTTYYPTKTYNIDSLGNSTKHIFANGMMVATIVKSPSLLIGDNPACTPPSAGDWTISTSCTFTGTAYAPQSITVNAGKLLTLAANSKLLIDFKHYKLLVKKTGGVLIKHTATLRQYKASDIGTSIYYQMDDHLTGQGVTTNSDGAVVELMDYYPYGGARLDEKTGTLTEQRKFIGQEYDAGTGLNYLNARYYNNSNGKFSAQDPVVRDNPENFLSDPQQLNYYSYARNNPITISDPTGKVIGIDDAILAGAIIGGLIGYFGQPRIANAPAPGGQTYASPSDSEIAGNTVISTYLGAYTLGSMALEYNTVQSQNQQLQNEIENGSSPTSLVAPQISTKSASLPNNSIVVRGGLCDCERFETGSGVIKQSDGKLQGVSVFSHPDKDFDTLGRNVQNPKAGFTTAGQVRNAGGELIHSPANNNPDHYLINGLSGQQLQSLFAPNVKIIMRGGGK